MGMQAKEIKEWLATVDDDAIVSIDDGGLSLVTDDGAYCEIGGVPDDEPEEVTYCPPDVCPYCKRVMDVGLCVCDAATDVQDAKQEQDK